MLLVVKLLYTVCDSTKEGSVAKNRVFFRHVRHPGQVQGRYYKLGGLETAGRGRQVLHFRLLFRDPLETGLGYLVLQLMSD